jgi:hypothetical protein
MILSQLAFQSLIQFHTAAMPAFNLHTNTISVTEIVREAPIDAVFYNPCCDEEVHITGTALVVINVNIIHLVVSDLTGTGLSSGLSFSGRGPSVQTNVFYANQYEGILTFKLNMVNADGCSFRLKATFQMEVNANGEVTVAFQKFDVTCS